ncbi:MAG: hypothetical protein DMD58_13025 [Gemmatimonadetes bacterium]|nr:MAG: hypothetical protein DMD58_13025 [Gemmatimonadota bacterium]
MGQLEWLTTLPSHYNNIIYVHHAAGIVSALRGAGGIMLTTIALLSLAVVSAPSARHASLYRPRIEVWTNRDDAAVFTRGERVRVYFRLDQDAYVTIFRVDTDGRVRVLFPRDPWEDNFARGGRDFEVDGRVLGSDAFTIDDQPGVGYLFGVASADAFVYDQIESGDHWDYRVIADGRVRGDPYVAMTDLSQRIVPEGYTDWDYDVVSYNVGQHYDYPRFLCYDCHSYVSYSSWDPYYDSCVRFRMFVYDDPWYYPYRYYGGSRVVFVRPFRPQPRFIFKDWGTDRPSREAFVSRERERPVNDNTRRGVTGRDIGGLGSVPPPNVRDRRGRSGDDRNNGGNDRGNNGNDRGNHGNDRGNNGNDRGNHGNRGNDDRGNRGNDDRGNGGRRQPSDPPMVQPPVDQPRVEPRRDEPRRGEPRVVEPRSEPRRDEPRRVEPRVVEPRSEPRRDEPRRVEPRNEPRSEPRRAEPQNEPRSQPQPHAEPRRDPPPREASKPRTEPEVRRRKP